MKLKNTKIRRILAVLAVATLVLTGLGADINQSGSMASVQADEYWPSDIGITEGATAVVMDMRNGVVLYDKLGEEAHYPASITKLMTALVAVENSSLDEVVTFSETAVFENEGDTSNIARDLGEEMTMEECLYGMLLESANECAYAIAEHVGGGDFNKFIDMMNEKAAELGCVNTHFTNSNGLHDDNHYTCAYDMALIGTAAYNNETVRTIACTKSYTIPPTNKHTEETPLHNSHAMISSHRTSQYLWEYALGGKTGFTDQALHTMVTFAEKDGLLLCCVVLNESDKTGQYGDTLNLLNYGFDNFVEYDVADSLDLTQADATGPLGTNISLLEVGEGKVVLPKTAALSDATSEITPVDSDSEEYAAGDVAATITYTYAGHTVGSADLLYTENSITSYAFHNIEEEDGGSTTDYVRIDYKMIVGVILLVLVAVLLVIIIIHTVRKNKRKKAYRSRRQKISKTGNNRQYTTIQDNRRSAGRRRKKSRR